MAGEVALRLLLKGQREMAAGLGDITKQGGELGKTFDKAAGSAKGLSGGLDSVQKQGVGATRSTKALIYATKQQADAMQAAAAASKQAADIRLKAAAALADATAKQAEGDAAGAKAARDNASALQSQAMAANRSAIAMRASASAARDQVAALKASSAAADMYGRSGGGISRIGGLAKVGGVLGKTGLAVGAYTGYEGVKRAAGIETTATSLYSLANVPKSQIGALQGWAIANSPRLREDPNTILGQMYRIASAAPGHPYSVRQLEGLAGGAAGLSVIGGSTVDPSQVARVFGIIKANGGLGTKSPRQIAAIAAATVGSGDMTMNDYISALGTGGLAVNAARHKINLTQLGGILAQEGDLGVTGSRAGTSLQHAISLLASPNQQASKIYGSLGLSATTIDQVMRTQGMTAGVALLKRALDAAIPRGSKATAGQFTGWGYSRAQAAKMAKQGPASIEDLYLTHLFGGAKQAVPIISMFQGLSRTNSKTAGIAANANPTTYNAHLSAAMNTPAMQWKNFDLGIQKLENNIGLKLIPKLESLANWVEKNKTDLEDAAKVIGIIAIPAIAAYGAKLVMSGVTNVMNFSAALRGQNTELSQVGGIASAQSRGIGMLGTAVMGVTAAVGVWELGKATRSHGAGGALTAGLGGAVTGMTLGLAAGGPWGAAIGGAGGALIGLASHFDNTTDAVDRTAVAVHALTKDFRIAIEADKGMLGLSTKSAIDSKLQNMPALTQAMQHFSITDATIMAYIKHFQRTGHENLSGPLAQLYDSGYNSKWSTAGNELAELLSALLTSSSESPSYLYATGRGGRGTKPIPRPRHRGHGGDDHHHTNHIHVYIDGREVTHTVDEQHRKSLARR